MLSMSRRHLRRCAHAHAFRLLAALVAVLLPLQGIAGAMAAIQAPAHYHLRAASPTARASVAHLPAHVATLPTRLARSSVAPSESPALLAGDIHQASSTDTGRTPVQEQRHAANAHPHAHRAAPPTSKAPAHQHHAALPAEPSPPAIAFTSDQAQPDHHASDIDAGQQGSVIDHHAHAFADAGVVYLDGSPDRPDGANAGKHISTTDGALTGWWMPLRSAMGMPSLPAANWRYWSHPATPALRPPAAANALTAD